jgi:predicted aminopeptidase
MVTTSCYVIDQGYHLAKHQLSAVPVEKLRTLDTLSPEEEAFFNRVDSIRRYADQHVGLSAGDSYRSYVSSDKDYLVAVVSAVDQFSFTRKEWTFPVVGSVPYRGYYRSEKARDLATSLRDDGWDVVVRRVNAFSTLGYFRDPLYSFMVGYDDARLAELIIHEMAHATLWLKGHSQFNEEFATFVGRQGALDYFVYLYGTESPEVIDLIAARHDAKLFREDIFRLRSQLEELYTAPAASTAPAVAASASASADAAAEPDDPSRGLLVKDGQTGRETLLTRKSDVIALFQREFEKSYDQRYLSDRYRYFVDADINNAWIDLYQTYGGSLHVLEEFHRVVGAGDLRRTIETIRTIMAGREALPEIARPSPMDMLRSHLRIASDIELRSAESFTGPNG